MTPGRERTICAWLDRAIGAVACGLFVMILQVTYDVRREPRTNQAKIAQTLSRPASNQFVDATRDLGNWDYVLPTVNEDRFRAAALRFASEPSCWGGVMSLPPDSGEGKMVNLFVVGPSNQGTCMSLFYEMKEALRAETERSTK